jgi:hypothetical protein
LEDDGREWKDGAEAELLFSRIALKQGTLTEERLITPDLLIKIPHFEKRLIIFSQLKRSNLN